VSANPKLTLLTFAQVSERTACGRTRIYAGMRSKTFPVPVRVGSRSLWVEAEIDHWVRERIAERDRNRSVVSNMGTDMGDPEAV
jgi:prophage regulatory protein